MEHYKSTFAVTGIALAGLMTAAGLLHPGNFERSQRSPALPAAGVAAARTAEWVDPPGPAPSVRRRPAPLSDAAMRMKPVSIAVLPADGVPVRVLAPESIQVAATVRRGEDRQKRKLALRAGKTRQAALDRQPVAPPAAEPRAAAPAGAAFDPIGDLIRGLGLGKTS